MTNADYELQDADPQGAAQASDGAGGQGVEAERVQRALLANLRNELRAPSVSIINYCEMLIRDAKSLGREDLVPDLRKIHTLGNRLLELVDDILDWAKFETGQRELDWRAFGANLRHELRTPLNAIIGYSEMLQEDVETLSQADLIADLQKIHFAADQFRSLIDKAVNFLEVDGRILSLEAAGTLPMIQEVMSAIQPLVEEEVAAMAAERGHLLVVDDNELNLDILSRRLERQGHTVARAQNGRQALEMLKADRFDLVLLDVIMPEMNGYQVLQRLRSDENWRDIPVIMISALDELDSAVRCIEAGAEEYMPKPFDPVLLKARVGAILEKKRLREKLQEQIVERDRLIEEIQRHSRRLAELNAIIGTITSTLALEQVLQRIVEAMSQFFPQAVRASIQLLDKDGSLHTWAASDGLPAAYQRVVFRPGEGIAGWAIQERRPINVPDVTVEPRYLAVPNRPIYHSLLVVPLISHDQLLGALSVSAVQVGVFDKEDEWLLQGLGGYAAIAVRNARLYEQTQHDAETKALLLREVNHRVKNNLAAIIGLLTIEQGRLAVAEERPDCREIIAHLLNRIQGLATVYDMLSAAGWTPLLLSELAERVIASALQMLPLDKWVSVDVLPSPVRVIPKQANSLALAINELATNAFKYALAERNAAHIAVSIALEEDDAVLFEFRDDGPGYPQEILQMKTYDVGLDLVQEIVTRDLNGELTLRNDQGAVAAIRFRL
jgi:two-component sensor histidine kinase/DNA-binding response OmpR family regulator